MKVKDSKIHIPKEDLKNLLGILGKHIPKGVKIFLYGSRAKGVHRPFSDLDLALEGEVSFSQLALLAVDLEASDLPFLVDVSRMKDFDPDFLKMIEGDFVEIQI